MARPVLQVLGLVAVVALILWGLGAVAFFMGTTGGEAPPLQFQVPSP